MDSNVSKETFLHKFLNPPSIPEKIPIAIEDLLKFKLLSALDLYRQKANVALNTEFINRSLRGNIVLLHASIESIYSKIQVDRVLLTSQLTSIVYSSSIALSLAPRVQKKPQIVAEELVDLWDFESDNISTQFHLNLRIDLVESGSINFYLDSKSIASWLDRSLKLLDTKTAVKPNISQSSQLDPTAIALFPVQYVHGRCCSLLRLGEREKLMVFNNRSESISWLDERGDLWLKEVAEFYLLRQLFLVTDLFAKESTNWHKLAFNFSQIIMIFLAECRFLGEIQRETPQKAIARLRLIAIANYWLERILVEKLNIPAPSSL
ncbi:hypothetical protein I4641_16675 [Waterburya agarophytonicola K14]|uniref:DALR anticodon binding domain-containing protein n=1 Tax=Waterburya agarophytonicola KI4 TaxID=2874699 RepID=A0A964BS21_9CYAN|nr:hypothetical protein [Waterburya agarophytonicola]MCC0178609.1 hypothetical protein [Waterburya agarophytonicola KI4]